MEDAPAGRPRLNLAPRSAAAPVGGYSESSSKVSFPPSLAMLEEKMTCFKDRRDILTHECFYYVSRRYRLVLRA